MDGYRVAEAIALGNICCLWQLSRARARFISLEPLMSARDASMVNVGERAPDVQLVDTDRKPAKISDFRGKKTVLAFFPGAFTGVCTKEMCTFRDGLSKFNTLGANVVGISVDSPFSNKVFSETNKFGFRVLSDYSREAVRSYGIPLENFAGLTGYTAAKRSIFILDKDGTVRFKWVSDDPSIEPNYDQVLKELEKVA